LKKPNGCKLLHELLALLCIALSVSLAPFPGKLGLTSLIGAKDDGSGGDN